MQEIIYYIVLALFENEDDIGDYCDSEHLVVELFSQLE
jgi:hypothetical protein